MQRGLGALAWPPVLTVLLSVLGAAPAAVAAEPAMIFLVRHAEKAAGERDPELNGAGVDRSQALAGLLRDAGIDAVFSTRFRRTRDTAAPLASQRALDVEVYKPGRLKRLAKNLRKQCGRCLVVGHSNTTPELVKILGGEPGPPIDEETEYDRLYVVTIGADGSVSTVLLRY